MSIDSLRVQGVRGIRGPITLSLAGKSLLLHGDNGTGKSSLDRALRWALLDEGAPTADAPFTTEESYRRHIEVAADYPSVRVTFTDGSLVEVAAGSVSTQKDGAALRAAFRAATPFLRRTELLDVLSSRPTDRFRYFESFLGLGRIDQFIAGLAAKRATAEGRRTHLAARRDSAVGPLAALIPHTYPRPAHAGDLEAVALRWIQDLGIDTSSQTIPPLALTLREQADAASRGDTAKKRARLEQLLDDLEACRSLRTSTSEVALKELAAAKVALEAEATDPTSVALLEHAYEQLATHPADTCPVCSNRIDPSLVKEALRSRIEAQGRYREVIATIGEHVLKIHAWCRQVGDLATRLAEEQGLTGSALALVTSDPHLSALASTPAADAAGAQRIALAADPSAIGNAADAALTEAARQALDLLKAVPPPSATPALQSSAALFARLVQDLPQLQIVESELVDRTNEVTLIDKALDALKRGRQDVAKETLAAIQGLVADYYFEIHPRGSDDDVTGAPSIQVQRHGAGSAFVRGEFSGKEVKDPQLVYSDGHLDTVGICIFLALRTFRARHAGDPKVMVLDDIIVSIDLGHARRLIGLLRTAFGDHQILILTHNGLFAHWCKFLMPGLRRIQITGWSLAGGPLVGDYPTAKERLNDSLAGGTPKEIALALMGLLDEWAAEARYAYAVSVPAKVGEQYTLTEIWEPFVKQIKTLGKALESGLGGALGALDTLADVTAIRNSLSAHDNDFAKEFPRGTLIEIAKAALALVDAIYCEDCQSFVTPSPNRTKPVIAHCTGNHKQYVKPATPLKSEP